MLLLSLGSFSAHAQNLPSTDIFLLKIDALSRKQLKVSGATNVIKRDGYDNQPSFSPDSKYFYYTSIRQDGQADVYRYELATGAITQVTHTPDDEYSPQVMPDGQHLSVVMVEADSTQRVWQYDLDGKNPKPVLEKVDSIGYYCWMSPTLMGLIMITEPATLRLGYTIGDTSWLRCSHAGRSVQQVPGQANTISFVDKTHKSDTADCIFTYSVTEKNPSPHKITRTLPGSEDYAWLPDGTIIMGSKGKLYRFNPKKAKKGWVEVADLSTAVGQFYRLAASPDGKWIAMVSYVGAKP